MRCTCVAFVVVFTSITVSAAPQSAAKAPAAPSAADALIDKAAAELRKYEKERKPGGNEFAEIDPVPLHQRLAWLRARRGDVQALHDYAQLYVTRAREPQVRDSNYRLIMARAHAGAGERDAFNKQLDEIIARSNSVNRNATLTQVAVLQAQAGEFDAAASTAEKLPGALQVNTYCDLAVIAAGAKQPEQYQKFITAAEQQAARAAEKSAGADAERLYLRPLAARIAADDLDGARKLADTLQRRDFKALALLKLAEAELKTGDTRRAGATINALLAMLPTLQKDVPGLGGGIAFRHVITIAKLQARRGDKASAVATLNDHAAKVMPDAGAAGEPVTRLAEAYAAAGDMKAARSTLDKALVAAKKMPEGEQRDSAYFRIAAAYAALNDLPAARNALKLVKPPRVPKGFPPREHPGAATADRQVAQGLIAAGNYKAADQYLATLDDKGAISTLQLEVARAAAAAQDFQTALKILSPKRGTYHPLAPSIVTAISQGYVKANKVAEVSRWASTLPPLLRATAYLAAAETMLEDDPPPPLLAPPPVLREEVDA